MAGVDLGDDGTLTEDEKCWILDKFYTKYLPVLLHVHVATIRVDHAFLMLWLH